MRILVVADIHANPAALTAVSEREQYDVCLCLGDLVDYGPCPGPCVDWVKQNCPVTVRGNHDHGLAQGVDIQGASGFRYLTMQTRPTSLRNLSEENRRFLADLPTTKMLRLGGKTFFLAHASPRDPLDEYVPPDAEGWKPRVANLGVDFVLVGHTHSQLNLAIDGTAVVNPGSVGQPRDGNPRARYAVITDGVVELKETAYDIDATVRAVKSSRYSDLVKTMLINMYTQGRYIHPPELPPPKPSGPFRPVGKKS